MTTFVEPSSSWIHEFVHELNSQFKQNLTLIFVSTFSYLAVFFVSYLIGFSLDSSMSGYIRRAIFSITPALLGLHILYLSCKILLKRGSEQPIKELGQAIFYSITDYRRYARMIPLLIIATFGFFAFVQFKLMLPRIVPFYADPMFIELDRIVHFGRLPNEWLSPLIHNEWIVQKIDLAYKFWYLPMFWIWGWAAWGADDNGWRRQYVLSFILCWIIGGSILAILLSSVGPCFYDPIFTDESPYQWQMSLLHQFHEREPLLAIYAQEMLLNGYLDFENSTIRSGISAMPSMHNVIAMLFVLAGYKINRYFGHVMVLYLILILIGSVVLGWHYAIDGYFGIVIAIVIWKAAGFLLQKQDQFLGIHQDV